MVDGGDEAVSKERCHGPASSSDGHEGHDDEPGHDLRDLDHGHNSVQRIWGALFGHSHDAEVVVDGPLETSRRGLRALWISFLALVVTAIVQAVIVAISSSVALLGDTLHNLSDAFTAIPLAIAFTVGRRASTRTFTYGYGRAEDLAGVVIVVFIAASAVFAGYEAIQRLIDPQEVQRVPLVAAAAVVGALGNELVARYRIRVGREIGSAALVADGRHARADACTSLAVLFGALGVGLGFPRADPIVGLLITVAIVFILRDAARAVYHRLMDAVDPDLVPMMEGTLLDTEGVLALGDVRVRWIGHRLHAECEVIVDRGLSLIEAHRVAEEAQHRLIHDVPRLAGVLVHTDPVEHRELEHHELSEHHADRGPSRRR